MTRAGRASTSPQSRQGSGSMPEGTGSKVAATADSSLLAAEQPARARPTSSTGAVTVPAAPPMGRVANVELMHTGTWDLSTGEATFTIDDLSAAVGALDCPAVRRPILKLGHTPDPAPGQPAVGFIANMATTEDGRTLVGDYVGLPGWLVDEDANGDSVLTSAYPDRSIEAWSGFRCQMGHTHPFVVTAVALLGEEQPAIGTIESLQDLANLYGVAAAAGDDQAGEPVTITVRARQGGVMPNRPTQIAASVTTEDVRRAFYASPLGDGWSSWVEEIQLDPLQLIVIDDDTSARSRIPVTIGPGDGSDAVAFGNPIPVVIRYDDVETAAAAAPRGRSVRYTSRDDNAGLQQPPQAKASAPGAPRRHPAPRMTAETMTVDAAVWREREALITRLQTEADRHVHAERDRALAQAVEKGKFPPSRRQHWQRLWNADPAGTREVIASLPDEFVPLNPIGHTGGGVQEQSGDELDEFAHLFPPATSW